MSTTQTMETPQDQARRLMALPGVQAAEPEQIMGVDYWRLRLEDGGDLYLTAHGQARAALLLPGSYWTDRDWFRSHSRRLSGTSTVYAIRTKPIGGRCMDLVLKWNRMGQDVPGATRADNPETAEFNSPFEEFALTRELRNTRYESAGWILTHKPLAIYVPPGRVEPDELGRRTAKLQAKLESHKEIDLDIHRNYAVIYEWIKGCDASEAVRDGLLDRDEMVALHQRAKEEMEAKGFVVRDAKPHHLIVRPRRDAQGLVRDREGQVLFASIDFELLERTAARERVFREAKRRRYLFKQAHRFEHVGELPADLRACEVFGVPYVFGGTPSTGGALWVVGRDPALFEYFLPEKWRRTARTKLSVANQIYRTTTKDNIHIVWRVSRVGEQPDMDPFRPDERRILAYGHNSPFEEVALALELSARGVATIYPRAIYRTGSIYQMPEWLHDDRRYRTHAGLCDAAGRPLLQKNHDYIILWGYWNGPDELLAERDEPCFTSISALHAWRQDLLDEETYLQLMARTGEQLALVGVEDLNLRGNHLLLSLDADGRLDLDEDGLPRARICNFELLRKIDRGAPEPSGAGRDEIDDRREPRRQDG